MRLLRSASLFFRVGEYTGMFCEPTPRSQRKDSDWKTYEPKSIRRFATFISIWKQMRKKFLLREAR